MKLIVTALLLALASPIVIADIIGVPATPPVQEPDAVQNASAFTDEPIPEGMARLIISGANKSFINTARVYIDSKKVTELKKGGDIYNTVVPVGILKLNVDVWGTLGNATLELNAKPNTIYLVKVTPRYLDAFAGFGLLGLLIESSTEGGNTGAFTIALKDTFVRTAEKRSDGKVITNETKTDVTSSIQVTKVNTIPSIEKAVPPTHLSNNVAGNVWQSKIANVPIYDKPDGVNVILRLNKAEEVLHSGEENGEYIKVICANGAGWVKKALLVKDN